MINGNVHSIEFPSEGWTVAHLFELQIYLYCVYAQSIDSSITLLLYDRICLLFVVFCFVLLCFCVISFAALLPNAERSAAQTVNLTALHNAYAYQINK